MPSVSKVYCEVCRCDVNPVGHDFRCEVKPLVEGWSKVKKAAWLGDTVQRLDVQLVVVTAGVEDKQCEVVVSELCSAAGQAVAFAAVGLICVGGTVRELSSGFEAVYTGDVRGRYVSYLCRRFGVPYSLVCQTAVAVGLDHWHSDVNVSSEYGDGYCAMTMVRSDCCEDVAARLGPWPTLDALLTEARDSFLSDAELRQLSVTVGERGIHVCRRGMIMGASVVREFGGVARLGCYPVGSLGEALSQLTLRGSLLGFVGTMRVGGVSEGLVPFGTWDSCRDLLERGLLTPKALEGYFQALATAGCAVSDVKAALPKLKLCDVEVSDEVSVVALGPKGGVSVGRGKNYERNRAARVRRQLKFEKTPEEVELQSSLEVRWKAENELAAAQAKRKLALLESRDLDAEKKMQRVQIMRTTEAAKVQTEKAYASLKRTGNVPGFAETVVTDGSCPALSPSRSDGTCISPDSSVSQQEIRAMMKELEDYRLTLSRIERDNPALVAHHMEGHGVKTAFTLDSDGMCPVDEPGCMGIDGKYHLDSYERNPKFYKDRFRAEEATEQYFNRE